MGTLIGSKERFAIEYDVAPLEANETQWLAGHCCCWAGGRMVGDYSARAALVVALVAFPRLLTSAGRRHNERLMALPACDVFREISSALYVYSGQTRGPLREHWDNYARFLALPVELDVFDGWIGFLVEDSERGRYIWSPPSPGAEVHEAILAAGEFDATVQAFLQDLERTANACRTPASCRRAG